MMQHTILTLIKDNKGLSVAIAAFFLIVIAVIVLKSEPDVSVPQRADFEVRGAGRVPNLTTVMKTNARLRKQVKEFCDKDENFVFGQPEQADKEIVEILLMWSGVDLDQPVTQKTREGLHPHVDHFIRGIYDMRDTSVIVNNPLVGKEPWLRLFNRYKARLIIQCAAGQKVYNGDIAYDAELDLLSVNAELSEDFMNNFKAFVSTQENPKRYINNLLVFIDETKKLKNLSDKERALISF